jgi:hypothetical protein
MGWFGSFMYDLKRDQNPFSFDDEFEAWDEWDFGWHEAQIEETVTE